MLYAAGVRLVGVSLAAVVGAYFLIGLICSIALGLSRPLLASHRSAIFVGCYMGILVYIPAVLFRFDHLRENAFGLGSATVVAMVAGGYTANRIWNREHAKS